MQIRRLRTIRPVDDGLRIQRIGRAAGVELKRVWIRAGEAFDLHEHDGAHLLIVSSGGGVVFSGGNPHAIAANDSVVIAPNEPHSFRAGPDTDLEMICADTPRRSPA